MRSASPSVARIVSYAKAAADRGATRNEPLETLGMPIYMAPGPAAMYASHALEAFDQFNRAGKVEAAAG